MYTYKCYDYIFWWFVIHKLHCLKHSNMWKAYTHVSIPQTIVSRTVLGTGLHWGIREPRYSYKLYTVVAVTDRQ